MEVTKWLKPSGSGSRIGDRAHDEGLVKGSHHGDIESSPVASVSKVQAHLRDAARFRARSTSRAAPATRRARDEVKFAICLTIGVCAGNEAPLPS